MLNYAKSAFIFILCTQFLLFPTRAQASTELDAVAANLIQAIDVDYRPRLAVLDLVPTQNEDQAVGPYLAEELLAPLIASKRFKLLERALIQKIVKEQGFSQSALANTDEAVSLGKLSGAEWVLLGRYTVLDFHVELNLRLISVEDGEILAVARGEIPKTDTLRRLAGEATTGEQTQVIVEEALKFVLDQAQKNPSNQPPVTQPRPEPQGPRQIFFEDFSRFTPGTRLNHLGPHLVVRSSQRHNMNVITSEDFRSGVMRLPIQRWPEHFRLEIHAIDTKKSVMNRSESDLHLILTDTQNQSLKVSKSQHDFALGFELGKVSPWRYLQWNVLVLERRGESFSLFVNGQPISQGRFNLGPLAHVELKSFSLQPWAFTRISLFAL